MRQSTIFVKYRIYTSEYKRNMNVQSVIYLCLSIHLSIHCVMLHLCMYNLCAMHYVTCVSMYIINRYIYIYIIYNLNVHVSHLSRSPLSFVRGIFSWTRTVDNVIEHPMHNLVLRTVTTW